MMRIPNPSIALEGEWEDEIERMKNELFVLKTWLFHPSI